MDCPTCVGNNLLIYNYQYKSYLCKDCGTTWFSECDGDKYLNIKLKKEV